MSEENYEPWSAAEIEEWEHDRWLKIQEMGDDFYKNEEDDNKIRRTHMNKKTEEDVEETNEKDKEEEQISNMDPRKLAMYCSFL